MKAPKMVRRTEADIAAVVVGYLEACGHDVYQEVEIRGGVIDIVALAGPARELWAIEAKATWSLDLLEQCRDRRRYAHRVFAAVPAGRSCHADLFEDNGIGSIVVGSEVTMRRQAPRVSADRRHGLHLRKLLRPGHKTHARAGAPSAAGRYTPFAATCDALRDFVKRNPGATMKMAIDGIRHHYGSDAGARSTLADRIRSGIVTGVEFRNEDGRARLWPADRSAA